MKVYQGNNESVNGSIQISNSELLYAKAQNGLLELSVSLGLEVMRMMLEEDVASLRDQEASTKQRGAQVTAMGQIRQRSSWAGRRYRQIGLGSWRLLAVSCRWKRWAIFKMRIH